jgi:hypothetical protein
MLLIPTEAPIPSGELFEYVINNNKCVLNGLVLVQISSQPAVLDGLVSIVSVESKNGSFKIICKNNGPNALDDSIEIQFLVCNP